MSRRPALAAVVIAAGLGCAACGSGSHHTATRAARRPPAPVSAPPAATSVPAPTTASTAPSTTTASPPTVPATPGTTAPTTPAAPTANMTDPASVASAFTVADLSSSWADPPDSLSHRVAALTTPQLDASLRTTAPSPGAVGGQQFVYTASAAAPELADTIGPGQLGYSVTATVTTTQDGQPTSTAQRGIEVEVVQQPDRTWRVAQVYS